jgi:hypothetical protein
MLTVETIGRIRREHFIKGKTIREIAREADRTAEQRRECSADPAAAGLSECP